MERNTKVVLGYVGVGIAAALIAGAAVWAVLASQLEDARSTGDSALEQVTDLEAQVASLTASLNSAEASAIAAADSTAQEETAPVAPAKPTGSTSTQKQFCFMRSGTWDGPTPQLTVDYAEILEGDEAAAAATAHGSESPPPNGYFIVNDNPKLRTFPADPGMKVKVASKAGGIEPAGYTMGFGQWFDVLIGMSSDNFVKDRPYWITLENGKITAIEEQYLP